MDRGVDLVLVSADGESGVDAEWTDGLLSEMGSFCRRSLPGRFSEPQLWLTGTLPHWHPEMAPQRRQMGARPLQNPPATGGFVVELRGFEPLTPCMPCKCSAELSYSPRVKGGLYQWATESGFGADCLPLDAGGITPETLQVVVGAGLGEEQVDDEVAVVE